MKIKVDAKGLACPKPVILAKNELEKIEKGIVEVTIDNATAKENLLKLAKSLNFQVEIKKEEENLIVLDIIKNIDTDSSEKATGEMCIDVENKCIFITKDKMGCGNKDLGKVLINSFVYTLTETKPYPKTIILVNGGVKLSTENEDTIDNLKRLEKEGVEILSCGTCLDFYNLKEELKVGTVTNMYNIVETLNNSQNSITI